MSGPLDGFVAKTTELTRQVDVLISRVKALAEVGQAYQVEDHRCILAHTAVVAVEVGLGVEQKVGDVHRKHQEQLTLPAVHGAVGAAQQQNQRRQDIEQRCEEDTEVSHIGCGEPCQQQEQRRQEVACANSIKTKQG